MGEETTGWARCANCHALDVLEYDEGPLRCENCLQVLVPADDLPVPEPGEGTRIHPVLSVRVMPCQTCGLGDGEEEWDPESEDNWCWECGSEMTSFKRRLRAEGFPVDQRLGDATEELGAHRFVVGDQGVCTGTEGIHLVGGGPFTTIQVIGIRPNGDLDVAAVHDGSMWVGVPPNAVLYLA